MAWAIISGLLASTVLTLLVVPAISSKVIKGTVPEAERELTKA
jgi:Cu/Ag efflux pump CusA